MIMRSLTYSWIGLSAAAPLIFLICAWVLGVFHSYRRHWRSVDLFLLAVFVQELLMALQVFAYALLSLMRPESSAACGAFVWSLSSTRTLQAATVASLLVDRALTSQWPYKYRFSVRRHQIRYHLAVLATIAALVGVAAILARPSNSPETFERCSFLPHDLHVRLSLFILSIYGILVVAGGISAGVVQAGRGCKEPSSTAHSDIAPITTTGSSSTSSSSAARPGNGLHAAASSASTTSSNASSGHGGVHSAMQPASSTSDLLPPPPPHRPPPALPARGQKGLGVKRSSNLPRTPASDFRWGTTVAVAALCFLVNHFPYMGIIVLGTFMPTYLGDWPVENIALWLSLAEGLFLPLVLGLVDATFSEAAGSSCSRDRPQLHPKYNENEGPFRLFPKEEVKSFPLTNGSLFSSLLNMNVDSPSQILPSYRPGGGPGLKMGVSSQEIRGLVGGGLENHRMRDPYGPPYYPREPTESLGSVGTSSQDPIYSDPLTKVGSTDSSLKEDHIYATLSETFGSMSSLSDGYLGDDQRCSSVTTVANDDFEFHDPRVSGTPEPVCYAPDRGVVSARNMALANRPPAQLPPEARSNTPDDAYHLSAKTESSTTGSVASSFRSSCSQVTATIENTKNQENLQSTGEEIKCIPSEIGYYNSGFETDTLEEKKEYFRSRGVTDTLDLHQKRETSDTSQEKSPGEGTLSRKHRSSSLSMNDLDRLDSTSTDKEEEMMFILPVKSESMLSLYRLYLAEDEAGTSLHYSVEISRSEGDLSALANATNPGMTDGKSENSLHEVYQKRRAPEVSGSRIKRQHKIQRAKGMQQRSKTRSSQVPNSLTTITASLSPSSSSSPPSSSSSIPSNLCPPNQGMQMTIMDKTRRRNGIITIQDPSVLSVEELFHVLDRASTKSSVPYTDMGDRTYSSPPPATPVARTEPDFKKIFVSEYL